MYFTFAIVIDYSCSLLFMSMWVVYAQFLFNLPPLNKTLKNAITIVLHNHEYKRIFVVYRSPLFHSYSTNIHLILSS